MFSCRRMLVLGAVLSTQVVVASTASAQQSTAVAIGTVRDTRTKQPIASAAVVMTSPSVQGEQMVLSDSSGRYRIPNLPPGKYTLRVFAQGYSPFTREGIVMRAMAVMRIDAALLADADADKSRTIVVKSPVVDVGSSSQGMNMTSEFTERVPIVAPGGKGSASRSFESVAIATPTAQNDTYGTSIAGTTSPENSYIVDGLSVGNPAFGLIGAEMTTEFVQEVNVASGGYMPEFGRSTGGILNAVTKSGSNEFHGGAWMFVTPGGIEGKRKIVKREGSAAVTEPSLSYLGDVGADIGGRIIKDRLWFYLGFQASQIVYNIDRYFTRLKIDPTTGMPETDSEGNTVVEPIPNSDEDFKARQTQFQVFGKLTYSPGQNDRIHFSTFYSPTLSGDEKTFSIDPRRGTPELANNQMNGDFSSLAHNRDATTLDMQLKWNAARKNKRLLFDTMLGWHHQRNQRLPSDKTRPGKQSGLGGISLVSWQKSNPDFHNLAELGALPDTVAADACDPFVASDGTEVNICPAQRWTTGGPGQVNDQRLERVSLRHDISYTLEGLGHHTIKGGIDGEFTEFQNNRAYTGRRWLRENSTGTIFADNRQYGFMQGPDQPVVMDNLEWTTRSLSLGAYIQDAWSIMDKVNLNFGLRYDIQSVYSGDGTRLITLAKQFSPRVGLIWDPTQKGKAKIFGNYARYYQALSLDLADRMGSGEPQIRSQHNSSDCNPAIEADLKGPCGDPTLAINTEGATSPDQYWRALGAAAKAPVDPNIEAQSTDEIVAGGEYEIFKDARLSASYTKRWMNRVIEDMSVNEAETYFLGNPGYGIGNRFPKPKRNFDSVVVALNKNFADHWLAAASYTLSFLHGNYNGLFRPETGQLDPNINSDFDLLSILPNRTGWLSADQRHSIKLFGAGEYSPLRWLNIALGGAFTANSGAATNVFGAHALYGPNEVFILPRGSGERLPWVFNVDTNLAIGFFLNKESKIELSASIFNLINFQQEIQRDNTYTVGTVLPLTNGETLADLDRDGIVDIQATAEQGQEVLAAKNPNFGQASQYQRPRQFRFGLRFTF